MSDTVSERFHPGKPLYLVGLMLALSGPALSYETDQFTDRLTPLEDSTDVLNAKVNEAIAEVAADWRWGDDRLKFCFEIYQRVGGRHWVDRLERWSMQSADVDRIELKRNESIYWGHPAWATRVAFLMGIGDTIRINDVMVGSDKIGHFFSQGLKFYRRFMRSESEAEAARHSAFTERAIFGQPFTGSYSNADLVANYEGHRFYRSLFEDNINGTKKAIVQWTGEAWKIQRPFDWSDHVNDYWDEALNINAYDEWLYPHMVERLKSFCGDFRRAPERYAVRNEDELRQRYSMLELRDTAELRLEHLCDPAAAPQTGSTPTQ